MAHSLKQINIFTQDNYFIKVYLKPKVTLHHILYALTVGHFSLDAIGIFLRFSGHELSVEVKTNHRRNIAKITGDRCLKIG